MERTFTPHSEFVAFYDYSAEKTVLIVTLKNGNRFVFEQFFDKDIKALKDAKNKGSYIYHNVFKNGFFTKTKIEGISAKQVQHLIQSQFAKRNVVNRYRNGNDEGWKNFISK